jgi:hypothetical protein
MTYALDSGQFTALAMGLGMVILVLFYMAIKRP